MPASNDLVALILDDSAYVGRWYDVVMPLAGIAATVVPNSDQAIRVIQQVHVMKAPLDVIVTDRMHPGLPGPDFIKMIRGFPDNMVAQGGLKIRRLPIVMFTAISDHEDIVALDPTIPVLIKPDTFEHLIQVVDHCLREYRDRLLTGLHRIGIGIQAEAGTLRLCHCFALPSDAGFETEYIDATPPGGRAHAARAYRRLVAVLDRHWSAQRSVQEFEQLLNEKHATEREFQHFFRLHPEFLYEQCFVDHWAEPPLHHLSTGKVLKPDFLLKSIFLPHRPWSWTVVDLKQPDVPLLTSASFHATLSQHVHRVIAQLRDYEEYFHDPANRKEIVARFGSPILAPRLVAIIGRLPKNPLLEHFAKLRGRVLDVSLMTYDEVLEFRRSQVEWRVGAQLF